MKIPEAGTQNKAGNIVNIFGVGVSSTPIDVVLKKISDRCTKSHDIKPLFVVTANPEIVMAAQEDPEYMKILNSADIVVADGAGLKMAGIKYVVPGRRLVEEIVRRNFKIFYLGGRNGVAEEMAKKYKGNWDAGEENIRAGERENGRIIAKINRYHPDVLLVAYGAPWQEKWIYHNLGKLKVKVVMGVGGTFDYLTGRKRLPPVWVEKAGLEWLWRLVHEPWRWRRQLNLVKFGWRIFA